MNRTGLIIALVIGAIAGAVFALDPALDLAIAAPFHAINSGGNLFGLRISPPLMLLRNSMLWFVTLVAFVPGGVLLLKLMRPTRPMLIAPRAVLLLLASLALGPGLLTNVILKDNWGRSRPIDVREFGGQETFVPWYSPRGDCPNNCSFVSGDVSGAAWLIAPAALTPLPWRPLAYAGALAFTAGMAVLRIAFGGHFFTDTLFAGVFTFLVIWLLYALIYRWPRTRLTDDKLDAMLTRLAMPGYRLMQRLLGRTPG
ncbi:MAG: phosphatase PAP2 family protein [Rhizobiales bacterium]|nr:phosphatase PAP2 family protein [Hyphomicrobiales bacterium]OJY45594.1 MAG: hypothetical protein BGP08_17825 [Rhizobiales bacterium 64-17]